MAEYKGIKGNKIQNYTTDPDNPLTGQVWYNETDQVLKFQYTITNPAWSTGGDLNTAKYSTAGSGTQNAALNFGGFPPPAGVANTESYDGSTWTEVNDLNASRYGLTGNGTQTSSLAIAGINPSLSPTYYTLTESWNGTSWTEVNDLNSGRYRLAAGGADNTSALAFGGQTPPITASALTESWNGTSWTEVNDLNSARGILGGVGTNTAALGF